MTESEFGAGTILCDRYELTDVIGKGGFGHVYRARQLNMDRDVAIKILPREFMSIADVVERFKREAKLASRLRHPNTITLHDYGQHEDSLFIVMELLTGEDLADVLKREGRLPLERIFHIATGILKSLSEAHRHGIVHRDLKPENIFLSVVGDDRDHVKVLDFGIAKLAIPESEKPKDGRKLTLAGSTVGTPAYMSPEQAAGEDVNGQTDLYALGVMMYEMACGRPPFHDEDAVKVMRAHLFDPVPPIRDDRLLGTLIDRLIQKALQKERAQRFKSASEFLLALAGEPVARPVIAGLNPDFRKRRITEDSPTTDDLGEIDADSAGNGTLAYAKSIDDAVPFAEVPDAAEKPRERETVSSNLTDASDLNDAPPGFRRDSAANTSSIIKVIETDSEANDEPGDVILLTKRKTPPSKSTVEVESNLRESQPAATPTTEEILAVVEDEPDASDSDGDKRRKRGDWSFGAETLPASKSGSFETDSSNGFRTFVVIAVLLLIAFAVWGIWF